VAGVPWQVFRGRCSVAGVPWQVFRGKCSVAGVPWQAFRGRCSVAGAAYLGAGADVQDRVAAFLELNHEEDLQQPRTVEAEQVSEGVHRGRDDACACGARSRALVVRFVMVITRLNAALQPCPSLQEAKAHSTMSATSESTMALASITWTVSHCNTPSHEWTGIVSHGGNDGGGKPGACDGKNDGGGTGGDGGGDGGRVVFEAGGGAATRLPSDTSGRSVWLPQLTLPQLLVVLSGGAFGRASTRADVTVNDSMNAVRWSIARSRKSGVAVVLAQPRALARRGGSDTIPGPTGGLWGVAG
jgi:hypothetical protein